MEDFAICFHLSNEVSVVRIELTLHGTNFETHRTCCSLHCQILVYLILFPNQQQNLVLATRLGETLYL